jgi:hypothetical protein
VPGKQAQMDWGHFGNWDGKRLYGLALTLGWSRMQYVEFTQRLNCMVHAFHFFGGVTATVLTDNMKTVVVDRIDGQPRPGVFVCPARDGFGRHDSTRRLGQKPPEMALVQGDDVVQQLTSATANPALRNTVLPGALDGGLEASYTHGLNCRRNLQTVFRIVIEDEKLGCRLVRKSFPQLLHNPGAGRMACDIEV